MKDRIRLPFHFDGIKLQKDLKKLSNNDWIRHFVTENYEGNWSVIPLRGTAGAEHPIKMIYSDPGCKEYADTPFLAELDYFPEVLKSFQCPLDAVRLMKLSAGSQINEHVDFDLTADGLYARLHIPVVTNAQVDFRLNGSRVDMRVGECWYLRLCDPHSVINRGTEDRVHLVLDVQVNQWLKNMLTSSS